MQSQVKTNKDIVKPQVDAELDGMTDGVLRQDGHTRH